MRASWVGTLAFPSFNIELPLRMAPATSEEKVELRMICRDHGSTVEQTFQCQEGGEYVERDNCGRAMVYGPEGREHVIVVTDEELASLKDALEQRIEIHETRSIFDFDPAFIVQSYRVWTEPPYERVFASLWRAMDRSQLLAIGTVNMSGRQYLMALRAAGKKEFTVYRLHWQNEVRDGLAITDAKADSTEVKAFSQALEALRRPESEPLMPGFENSYVKRLTAIIAGKETEFFAKRAQTA